MPSSARSVLVIHPRAASEEHRVLVRNLKPGNGAKVADFTCGRI